MVEISLSGSGEGPGRSKGPGLLDPRRDDTSSPTAVDGCLRPRRSLQLSDSPPIGLSHVLCHLGWAAMNCWSPREGTGVFILRGRKEALRLCPQSRLPADARVAPVPRLISLSREPTPADPIAPTGGCPRTRGVRATSPAR
jgi:hypothetical protein